MPSSQDILIRQLELGNMANYNYLIADTKTREAAVIDPCDDTAAILDAAKADALKIKAVLLTHGHFDHVGGAAFLSKTLSVPVYLSEHEPILYTPRVPGLKRTKDKDVLPLGAINIECLHTPGHSPGGQCFLVCGHLFTGDTLFIDAVGRADLPGGSERILLKSLERIKTLPDETIIWPGHNYGEVSHACLGDLKKTNPFLM